jgi:hypothetical protein
MHKVHIHVSLVYHYVYEDKYERLYMGERTAPEPDTPRSASGAVCSPIITSFARILGVRGRRGEWLCP